MDSLISFINEQEAALIDQRRAAHAQLDQIAGALAMIKVTRDKLKESESKE